MIFFSRLKKNLLSAMDDVTIYKRISIAMGILACILVFCGFTAMLIVYTTRKKYNPNMTPNESIQRFLHDYWVDGDVLPRTHPASSPVVPEQDSSAQDVEIHKLPSVPTVLSQHITQLSDRVLDRNVHGVEPLILPCELTNGGLPLLMVRVEDSPPTKVVLDTASDYLLIADKDECKKCSVKMYGGARSDPSQEHKQHFKVYFGSQIDKVQFQTLDIQLGDFAVLESFPVGIVKARETRIKKNTRTFNIMGIGAMGMRGGTMGLSLIERLLRYYGQPDVFGFYFGTNLRDGLFVLGYVAKKTEPIFTVPLYPHMTKPYYLLKLHAITLFSASQDRPIYIENDNQVLLLGTLVQIMQHSQKY